MDIEKYIGFRVEAVKPLLHKNNINYNLVEIWDTKKTKMGDDLRIIKIDDSDGLITIYVSYF